MIPGIGYTLRSTEIATGTSTTAALLGIRAPTKMHAFITNARAFVGGIVSNETIGFGIFLSSSALTGGNAEGDPDPCNNQMPTWNALGGSTIIQNPTAIGNVTQSGAERCSFEGNIMSEAIWVPSSEQMFVKIPAGDWAYIRLVRAPNSTKNVVFRLDFELV